MIGIKIADGSFYPILEEGKAGEKRLEITTARDEQTTIQVNLYRSETGKMEDADYVDTLLIDNLVPHPKEEPSFGLLIKIDENNMLSAEIEDPETGERADISDSLVNMGAKSIFDEPDYSVTAKDSIDDSVLSGPLSEDPVMEAPVIEDSVIEEPVIEETVAEEPLLEEPEAEAVLSDDDFSFSTDFLDDDKSIDEEEKPFTFDSLPDFDEIPELSDNRSQVNDDLDIDFSIPEEDTITKSEDNYTNYMETQPEYEYAQRDSMTNALFSDDNLFEETKRKKDKKLLISIVICALCAVISIAALAIILYLTPSIMKLTGMNKEEGVVTEQTVTEEVEEIMAEEEVVVANSPTVRQSEENRIVVLNETVPPVVPGNKNNKKEVSSIIQHLVKWGDTLWDLAGFYYRNPWLYRIISDANNLENPDFILSGTYLSIPEQ
ncbi:MAG: LysM peptidoglycan-binding domain-containing protein [Treponemataceae bacterium]|nr:LysM peptidoglycan-binding domain-containing protein [Treponemataceae bacterium]